MSINFAATLLGNVFRNGIMPDVQTSSVIVGRFCKEVWFLWLKA